MSRFGFLLSLGVLFATGAAFADDPAATCAAGSGVYLSGPIVDGPKYRKGKPLNHVDLSHTHFKIKADQTGAVTDVAADNVFAAGHSERGDKKHEVPAPLDTLKMGQRVSLCGLTYDDPNSGPGIHWVHTNCGVQPSPQQPTGWVEVFADDGTLGPNLEGSSNFCYLWPPKK